MLGNPHVTNVSSVPSSRLNIYLWGRQGFVRTISLGWMFFARDVKAKYRESFLGLTWTIIPIVLATVGFYVATKSEILSPGKDIVFPYVAYVFCGMMFWYLFVDTLTQSVSAMKGTRNLFGRVSFPVLSIFLATAFQTILDFLIRLVLFGFITFAMGCWREVWWPLFLPVGMVVVVWALALALLIIPFSILIQDMFRFLQIAIEYGVFVTPVAFQLPSSGALTTIMKWNPLTYLIPPARDLVLGLSDAGWSYLLLGLPLGAVLLFLSIIFFNICLPHLVERIS